VKYAFIRAQQDKHKVKRMCEVLDVSPSGYYDWVDRPESNRARENRRLVTRIRCFHRASKAVYGSPRIHEDLLESGERVGVNRVARLMKQENIQSKVAKQFVITTESKHSLPAAPDRLNRQFQTDLPDQAWVSDTTFIPTRQGWLFLAVILDLYSRQVIGWAMGNHNNSQLVSDALTMAIWRRGRARDVIVHSDRGATYASSDYQKLLNRHQLLCSMSRKGECLDNAVAESFFSSLKTELVDHEDYRTREEARQSLFEYIEIFYNRRRRHSYLGYISPVEFERRHAPQ
jgi:transposase InsO family protein